MKPVSLAWLVVAATATPALAAPPAAPPAPAAQPAPAAPRPAGPAAPASPTAAGSAPAGAARGRPLGVLDLEAVAQGEATLVRDAAYQLEFPWAPTVDKVEAPLGDGARMVGGMGIVSHGDTLLGFVLMPIPQALAYDVEKGLRGARDQGLAAVGAKLVSDQPVTLGGLAGRKVRSRVQRGASTLELETYYLWDARRRVVISLLTGLPPGSTDRARRDAFVASFRVLGGAAPPATLLR